MRLGILSPGDVAGHKVHARRISMTTVSGACLRAVPKHVYQRLSACFFRYFGESCVASSACSLFLQCVTHEHHVIFPHLPSKLYLECHLQSYERSFEMSLS